MAVRVGIVGSGLIGSQVSAELVAGRVRGAVLAGVVGSRSAPADALDELALGCDILVEAAGVDAVAVCFRAARAAATDLIVCSTGAFAQPGLLPLLDSVGSSRLILASGAIGGIDLLRAVSMAGAVRSASLVTTKHSRALGADDALGRHTVFEGSAREAIGGYPATANVAVTLALATLGLDRTSVRMIADPDATGSTHEIEVSSDLGSYRFEIRNAVVPGGNARTSALTAWSVLVAIQDAVSLRLV